MKAPGRRPLLVLTLVVLVVAPAMLPPAAPGQPAGPVRRVGLLGPDEEPRFSEIREGLRQGLREAGYPDGAVVLLEARGRRGDESSVRRRVEELARQQAEAVLVIGSAFARIARRAAPDLPIVFITPGDPVAAGLAASLTTPGSRMTAITVEYPELSAKRLELLRELAPRARRVLTLYDPRDESPRQAVAAARTAAGPLGLALVEREVRSGDELRRALEGLAGVDALLGIPGGLTAAHYAAMIRATHDRRILTVFPAGTASAAAAVLTYGAGEAGVARQAARTLAKILAGADAGQLPVERPVRISLILNLRSARMLGLTIPPTLLLRADQVVE